MSLTNQETIHKFRDGHRCRSSNGNVYSDDGVKLFSYGSHFTLAARINSPHCQFLINGDKASSTTSQHTGICQAALPGITIGATAFPFDIFDALLNGSAHVVDGRDDRVVHTSYQQLPEDATPQNGWELRRDKDGDVTMAHRPGGLLVKLKKKIRARRFRVRSGFCTTGYYLCGMDEGSYFCVLLPFNAHPQTIEEAFEALEPVEVLAAKHVGLTVHRQGEWYFIEPMTPMVTKDLKHIPLDAKFKRRWKNAGFRTCTTLVDHAAKHMNDLSTNLRALDLTPLQPATAEVGNLHCVREIRQDDAGTVYCRGKVVHRSSQAWNRGSATGEHRSVMLQNWHQVHRNRARNSWSAEGNVD